MMWHRSERALWLVCVFEKATVVGIQSSVDGSRPPPLGDVAQNIVTRTSCCSTSCYKSAHLHAT